MLQQLFQIAVLLVAISVDVVEGLQILGGGEMTIFVRFDGDIHVHA